MTAGQLLLQALAGLGSAMSLVLVASGLSLIFGVRTEGRLEGLEEWLTLSRPDRCDE